MERARLAVLAAWSVLIVLASGALAATAPPSGGSAPVSWPPATLLVSELQTGGASASDEFIELANTGGSTVDLSGLEVVYVTSTGGTITKKAAWTTSRTLEPGRHLLIANSSGTYAGIADATYSGGLAATGGTVVLRATGGAPLDAVGWGDATNAFVEGDPAAAPAPGSSLERRPGGLDGNGLDSNDNAADFIVQVSPNPQDLAAPPAPAPAPSATATPPPDPTATPDPTADPTAVPSGTPAPSPSDPTPSPDPTATPGPSVTPDPRVGIAVARQQADGTVAAIEGVLTTDLGALESGRSGFIQDATGGIGLYLSAAVVSSLPAGTVVRAIGTLDERYGQRVLRVDEAAILAVAPADLPSPLAVATGLVSESVEGWRVVVEGATVGSPAVYADGLGILVDDGTGPVRAILAGAALGDASLPAGTSVRVTGPVGQRDSTGLGTSGYRIVATLAGELEVLPSAEPTPSPTPSPPPEPTPSPTPSPTPTPSPSPSPSPTPTPTPAPTSSPVPTSSPTPGPSVPPLTIAEARARRVGAVVTVAGIVTAESGRIGSPALIVIGDSSGGLVVRLPSGTPGPARGTAVVIRGQLADPYGQLEIRPVAGGFVVAGTGSLPSPVPVAGADLGEVVEGRLVTIQGVVAAAPKKGTNGDLIVDLRDPAGTMFRVMTDGSSGIAASDLPSGATLRLTGVVGQRASSKGALDGYRVWPRDRADLVRVTGTTPGPAAGAPAVVPIATARASIDGTKVRVEGVVIAGAALLDASGRRVVLADASGAIEILLPSADGAPGVGARIRVDGVTGHAWGAPRVAASAVDLLGHGEPPAARPRATALGVGDEWALVRVAGTIEHVERLGDRWRAEVVAGGVRFLVTGLTGAGIPSTVLIEGRPATVVGLARRPYPTATDRRFAVVPRGPGDVVVGPEAGSSPAADDDGGPTPSMDPAIPAVELARLSEHIGEVVRVGGVVAAVRADGIDLDDGTAVVGLRFAGGAAGIPALVQPGDALAADGRIDASDGGAGAVVTVTDPAAVVRVGALGQAMPLGGSAAPSASPGPVGVRGDGPAAAASLLALPAAGPGLGAVAGVSLLSLAMRLAREQARRRRDRAAVLRRLAALAGPSTRDPERA